MAGFSLDGVFELITAKRDSPWKIVWLYHRWMSEVSEIKTGVAGHLVLNGYFAEQKKVWCRENC
jgi:hypothetical protein